MKNYKQVALEIAAKYKFEPLLLDINGYADVNNTTLSHCANHLDSDFMKSLESLEFLDSKYLSK